MLKRSSLVVLLTGALTIESAGADGGRGLEIAKDMLERDQGYETYITEVEMLITAANDDTAERRLTIRGQEQANDGDRIVSFFHTPRDLAGTALLTYSHALEADDQWLYLPSLQRVKRIASNNQSGPFMGSEFAYEDMSSWELEKYRYEFLREETEQHDYWVLACYPQYPNSGYSKLVVWIDKAIHQPRKIEYIDRKGSPLKQLTLTDYRLYKDRFWRPHRSEMVNLQNQRKTTLQWQDYQIGVELSARHFHPSQLRFASETR
jgi:outer membrane lipoprotein-sorting protein